VTVLPIAHSPVFKIFDLAQISVGFRDEAASWLTFLMSSVDGPRVARDNLTW
jgi:hypothetical protein